MRHLDKVMLLALAGYLTLAPVVMAAPLTGDAATMVTQRVHAGVLTLQAPGDVDMGTITVSTQVESTTATAENFMVDDARGKKNPAGWSAVVTMTNFSGTADDATTVTIPFVDTVAAHNNYTLSPLNLVEYNGADPGVVLGSAEELTESTTAGLSNPKTVMTAAAGEGQGRYGSDMQIDLRVPANSAAADYTSTMTFTVA